MAPTVTLIEYLSRQGQKTAPADEIALNKFLKKYDLDEKDFLEHARYVCAILHESGSTA